MLALLRPAVAVISALLLSTGALAQTPSRYGVAPGTTQPNALDEGPVAPPVLAGPGAAVAGRTIANDDGVLVTRPDEEDQRSSSRDGSCRMGGAVDLGIGGGGGMMERDVGATLTYGQNGNPWRPCDDSHIGFAVSVSRGSITGSPKYRGDGRYLGDRSLYDDRTVDEGRLGLDWARTAPALGGP